MRLRRSLVPWRRSQAATDLWDDTAPVRAELFGSDRLEHHALSLAAAQVVTSRHPLRVPSLVRRVDDNAKVLLSAYRISARALQSGQQITPSAEWLLDNFHIVEQQLRQVADD